MDVPNHAFERILGRTRMSEEEVMELIQADVCSLLEIREGREFLLFYLPFERAPRVAIVTFMRKVLVSVVEASYDCIKNIDITPQHMREAKERLERYTWKRVIRGNNSLAASLVPLHIKAIVSARGTRSISYKHDLGLLPQRDACDSSKIVSRFAPALRDFTREMEFLRNKNWARDNVRYSFVAGIEDGAPELPSLNHNALVKIIRAVSS